MKAWQFTAVGEPLTKVESEDPTPGPDDVLVETGAVGLCHSDIGFMDGTITSLLGHVPITLGHEIVGTVVEVGSNVTEFAAGDRIGIPATTDGPGTAINGGYAQKVVVPARLPVTLPDGLSFRDAAPATCSGRTAYRAVHTAGRIESGMKVGIIGFGGLGFFGVQIALAAGATVYVSELNESRWASATELGATAISKDIRDFESEELDLIIDFAGAGNTLGSAVDAIRHGGRIVEVGLGSDTTSISIPNLTMKEVQIVGSSNGTKEEARAILELFADGSVRPNTEQITFDDIPAGLHRLEEGSADARLIAVY
ncbi:alcohol dehydrogenase catalytic domain-containing protein [Rhodococcoides kyotonense]|uniref:alcohol dehydrogenase n=1 Tax=Rhodococcoides kyotonense TaxID=398843 RepID=A0A239MT03_9NOCA|nr:zinc-binding dehydrogenase [Rhodococcus kyotonensis]SNT45262.1 hypothetical protein/alcohol dehydrogenase, propanol-preferring [Rhodococcus kyotonensis]